MGAEICRNSPRSRTVRMADTSPSLTVLFQSQGAAQHHHALAHFRPGAAHRQVVGGASGEIHRQLDQIGLWVGRHHLRQGVNLALGQLHFGPGHPVDDVQIGDEVTFRVDEDTAPQADDLAGGIEPGHGDHRGQHPFNQFGETVLGPGRPETAHRP